LTHRPIKLLVIEDSEDDTFLLIHQLKRSGFEPDYKRVETADEMCSVLSNTKFDIVISDHSLPMFNAIEALSVLQDFDPDLPLIVLSGDIDQNIAVEAMRLGARDYIMKDDPVRLIPAIDRELHKSELLKEARQAEARNRRDLQAIMDHSPAVIYIKDTEGCYTFINQQFEQLFHITHEGIMGKTDYDIFPKDVADVFQYNDKAVLETRHAIKSEDAVLLDDGLYTFVSIKFPLFDEVDEIYSVCGISTDISDYKQQEEQLRRGQKMDAIGQLSGGIAHEFNNQLGVIIGHLDFLDNYTINDKKSHTWVETAIRGTLRCMDLTRQLLTFSRRQATEKTVVDLNVALKELQTMIVRSITPEVEVQYCLADDLQLTEIDPGEFHDAILNMVINARDAMPSGGKLLIETSNKYLDKDYASVNSGIEVGDYVRLVLSDTGAGMDEVTQERIFEPFFTTKPEGKGTGLGMSMVYGFVKRYGGYIKVYSERGVGTAMHLYLPCSTDIEATIKVDNEDEGYLPTGTETILIVDDEDDLLQLANQYLSGLGYQTRLATSAAQALEILEAGEEIHLLFSDVVMPGGINGYELAQQATKQWPDLKVLMTSGFTSKTMNQNGLANFSAYLLNKPYRVGELAQRVRLVLDEEVVR